MTSPDDPILKDFQDESKALIEKMISILDQCEGSFSQVKSLEEYGQTVDRIMGGATSLAMALATPSARVQQIGDYAGVCKAVGYKASQIKGNEQFYDICVALLQDATEVLEALVDNLFEQGEQNLKSVLNQPFIDRLKWVSDKFGAEYRASVDVNKKSGPMDQAEIDDLLRKLGLD